MAVKGQLRLGLDGLPNSLMTYRHAGPPVDTPRQSERLPDPLGEGKHPLESIPWVNVAESKPRLSEPLETQDLVNLPLDVKNPLAVKPEGLIAVLRESLKDPR